MGRRLRVGERMTCPGKHGVAGLCVHRVAMAHGAEDAQFIHAPSEPWKHLADLNAGHGGRDRPKLPANLGRSVRLGIPSVLRQGT